MINFANAVFGNHRTPFTTCLLTAMHGRSQSRQFAGGGRVHAVFGNDACDLDSASASLTYAYLLSTMDTETVFVPVLNIPEQEYPLKTEVTFFLHKLGIGKEHLIFR